MKMLSAAVLRTQPDEKLTALAAEGSDAAFEAIVQRYRRMLLAYCRRLLLSDVRSEDVLQQTFIRAWESLQRGDQVREPKAWLYRIAHNQAISALRRPGYECEQLSDSLRGAEAPDAELERRMLMRQTLAAVAALPRQQREAILRTAVEGESYEQAAVALGVSDNAVRGLVHRARTGLRAAMAAVAPGPLVTWAAIGTRRGSGDIPQRLSEAVAAGGSGGAAVMFKGATVIVTSAVLVGGTVTDAMRHHRTPRQRAPAAARAAVSSQPRPAALVGGSASGTYISRPQLASAANRSSSAPLPASPAASGPAHPLPGSASPSPPAGLRQRQGQGDLAATSYSPRGEHRFSGSGDGAYPARAGDYSGGRADGAGGGFDRTGSGQASGVAAAEMPSSGAVSTTGYAPRLERHPPGAP